MAEIIFNSGRKFFIRGLKMRFETRILIGTFQTIFLKIFDKISYFGQ